MGIYGKTLLDELGVADEYPGAEYGFLLHDVGKVGIPDSILLQPSAVAPAFDVTQQIMVPP